MKDRSIFQLVLMMVFGFAILIAVLIFAGILPGFRSGGSANRPTLLVWGYFSQEAMAPIIETFNQEHDRVAQLVYVEKNPDTFEADIGNSIAGGAGPDIIFFPDNLIIRHGDKVVPFSNSEYSLRNFRNDFVEQGEMFIGDTGALALPILVDPMVLFYNRDLLSAGGVARPPVSWTEMIQPEIGPVARLTLFDVQGNLAQSAVSMGEFSNVSHAKEILSLLMMQAGSRIVSRNDPDSDRDFAVDLGGVSTGVSSGPAASAVDFYMQFSNPTKSAYTWNRAMPMSLDAFAAGFSAMYLGFAGELGTIRQISPVLNVDVALMPQREQSRQVTAGRVYGLAATAKASTYQSSKQVIKLLLVGQYPSLLAEATGLVPASRVLLSAGTSDPYDVVFYQSALVSRSWYDPMPAETNNIFRQMIEGVGSGRIGASEAVSRAQTELFNLVSGR